MKKKIVGSRYFCCKFNEQARLISRAPEDKTIRSLKRYPVVGMFDSGPIVKSVKTVCEKKSAGIKVKGARTLAGSSLQVEPKYLESVNMMEQTGE